MATKAFGQETVSDHAVPCTVEAVDQMYIYKSFVFCGSPNTSIGKVRVL